MKPPLFAHASEAELARILDYYQVAWEYEPRTFPILWNLDGKVVESFSPDFYLPELDLFVELTTLKQSLVRKKNRKLRRLRELYPEIRIKLFYARDFKALLLKYGRIDQAASLSGPEGQARPGGATARTLAAAAVVASAPSVPDEPLPVSTTVAADVALAEPAARRRRRRRRATPAAG